MIYIYIEYQFSDGSNSGRCFGPIAVMDFCWYASMVKAETEIVVFKRR